MNDNSRMIFFVQHMPGEEDSLAEIMKDAMLYMNSKTDNQLSFHVPETDHEMVDGPASSVLLISSEVLTKEEVANYYAIWAVEDDEEPSKEEFPTLAWNPDGTIRVGLTKE